MTLALSMKNITKDFPGVRALNKVDFELEKGEVHSIIGANGAGKSTLIKILSGIYDDYKGSIRINSKPINIKSPEQSLTAGVSVITQEFNLASDLTIAENVFLGIEPFNFLGVVDTKKINKKTEKLLKIFNINANPKTLIKSLSIVEKQVVEIIKSLQRNASIILMDEPTAALSKKEIKILHSKILDLKKQRKSLILISHKFDDIYSVSDRVTILRDGNKISTYNTHDVSHKQILKDMFGKEIKKVSRTRNKKVKNILEVKNINTKKIQNINFYLREQETLGILDNVSSSGSEILKSIFGLKHSSNACFSLENKEVQINSPSEAINQGIVFITEDRKNEGIFPFQSVANNITLPFLKSISSFGIISKKKSSNIVNEQIKNLNIKTPNPEENIQNLSGGNQQKVILSRWLYRNAKIFLFNEPTRGIDVKSKSEIYKIINDLKSKGKSCLIVSGDLEELNLICDRILTFKNNKLQPLAK